MPSNNFIKNITSKDVSISKNTILNMIKTASLDDFSELCQNSDFIFPFLKERITNDFVKLINEEDIGTIFKFSEIYCADFENLIVNAWRKFASEDLTDEILELFNNGNLEQKTYCALYFKYIQDPLALEYLNKYAFCDFEPLKCACAQTLSAFKDSETYEKMKNIVLNSEDDFEKTSALGFISAYKGQDNVDFIVNHCFDNPFKVNIIANLLDYNDFDNLKNLSQDKIIQIFSTLIEGYPEDISLDTIGYYRILDFIKLINSYNNQYAKNALILAKEKFKEFSDNDIYTFDLDKNSKNDLKEICNALKLLPLEFSGLKEELKEYNTHRFKLALSVIQELNLKEYASSIAKNLNFLQDEYIALASLVLKELGCGNLISDKIIEKIQNENIKALVKSCKL
ncbi:MAG: hypothetical protein IJ877_04595 [Candidatus Gastranaerophilales bacterium]|nr:hypothetical protein [Candidatus Gastranaerophilales bacterium]